ncbi:hypothetical protein RvY_01399 [Ramazzottius varieornatus]|uniref:Uncharacterized protein n=1 Tax=Ramazzottius varieornatus TaxID=947166 RepID=A0A1D1UM93_RAMVA|nr:hypothetical protein RvY_01399 [Ramazzottius varieornatus]
MAVENLTEDSGGVKLPISKRRCDEHVLVSSVCSAGYSQKQKEQQYYIQVQLHGSGYVLFWTQSRTLSAKYPLGVEGQKLQELTSETSGFDHNFINIRLNTYRHEQQRYQTRDESINFTDLTYEWSGGRKANRTVPRRVKTIKNNRRPHIILPSVKSTCKDSPAGDSARNVGYGEGLQKITLFSLAISEVNRVEGMWRLTRIPSRMKFQGWALRMLWKHPRMTTVTTNVMYDA